MKYPCYYCRELIELRRKDCPHCEKGLDKSYLDEIFNLDQVVGQLQRLREMDFLSSDLYKRLMEQCNLYLRERGEEIHKRSLQEAAGDLISLGEKKPTLSLAPPPLTEKEEEVLSPKELQDPLKEARGKAAALVSPEEEVQKGEYIFTSEMLDCYGEEQRDTLASLFKLISKMAPPERKKILGAMVEKIAKKIDYPEEIPGEDCEKFLRVFHQDLSEYLEKSQEPPTQKYRPKKIALQKIPPKERVETHHLEAFKNLIMDNVLWVVSAFLMISGALFFVVSSWKGLSGTNRLTLSSFSLTGLAAFLLFGSHLLKKYKLSTPSGVLSWIGLAIFPFSFVILSFFPGRTPLPLILFGIQAALMSGLFFLFLASPIRKGWEFIHLAVYLFFGGLHLLLPLLTTRNHLVGAGYLSALLLYLLSAKLYRAGFFPGLGIGFISLLIFGGNLLLHLYRIDSASLRYLSPLLIAASFLASRAWEVFREGKEDGPTFHSLLHLGYGLAILGVLLSFGSPYTLLISATLATLLLGRDALRYDLPLLLIPCYFCSVIAYFLSPLPFKHAVLQIRDSAATALGYSGQKLPFAYYGLTFFPYLCATGYLSYFFQKRDKPQASAITRNWVFLLSAGLLALAHLTTSDLRAALFTLPLFMGACYFFSLKTRKGGFGEIAILCTALMVIDTVRHFDLGWQGFFWGLLVLSLFYHTLENLLEKGEEDPFLSKNLEAASLISYCLLYVFFFKLLGHRPDELAGPLAGMGFLSVYLGLWRKDNPLLNLGLTLILASYPLYFYGTPVFPFGLPLGLLSILAALILIKMLLAQFPSLSEKYGLRSREILKDFLRVPTSLTLGASLLIILGESVYKGPSYSLIEASGAVAFIGLILAFVATCSLSSRVAIGALGLAYLFYWRLEGLPPVGVPIDDWRGMVMAAGVYSFLILIAALVAKIEPSFSEEKWRKILWIPTLDFSRVVVTVAFFMGLILRLMEVSGTYSAENLYIIPLIGLSLCTAGVFLVSYFSSAREGAAFLAVLGLTTALLGIVDLCTSSHQPILLAAAVLSLIYLSWGLFKKLENYNSLGQLCETSLHQAILNFSLYLFVLGTICWFFEFLRSMGREPSWTVPLALSLLGLYGLLAFLWNSRQSFAFFFQLFGLALLAALHRHIEEPIEIFLLSTLVWTGLMVFLGYWTRSIEGKSYLKWQGEPFYRASILTLFLVLVPHIAGGSFVSLGLLANDGAKIRLYLGLHGFTMGLYLGGLFALSLAATWIKREKVIATPLISLLISSTFYPLLSGLFKIHKPVLEFGLLALLIHLIPWQRLFKKSRALIDGECASWGIILNLSALYILGFKTGSPLLFMVLYLAAVGFWLSARALKSTGYLTLSYLAALLAHCALALYLVPKTGAPAYQILPLFGAIALVHQALGRYVLPYLGLGQAGDLREHLSSLSQNMSYLAMAEVGFYSLAVGSGAVQGANLILTTLCALAILYFTYRDLYEKGSAKEAYLFVFALTFSYIFFSTKTVFLAFLQGYAPHGMFLLALAFSQPVILGGVKEEALQVLQKLSFYYPLLGFFLIPHGMTPGYTSGLLLTGALFYGLLWQTGKSTRSALMASLFLNHSLFFLWRSMSIMDPQFYGIPLGITLVFLAQIPHENLREEDKKALETVGFLIVFGSSAFQAFQVSSPIYALMLGSLSLAGILIGRILKWTNLVNLGVFFLVVDILSFLLRSGLSRGLIAALILTIAGILVFVMAVAFHDKREGEES